MRLLSAASAPLALIFSAVFASAALGSVVIHDFDHLAMAPDGSRIADVEADDPGNLPDEPHGHVVVRDIGGKIAVTYDPCRTCKYSAAAFSPNQEALAFLGTDESTHK